MLLENEPGALSRVVGLFSQRGYNIETLNVAPTDDPTLSRLTLTTIGHDLHIEQITKQLNKLVDVVKVSDLTGKNFIDREMVMMKVQVTSETRAELLGIVDIFRCKVVDVSPKSYTLEATGDSGKIQAIIEILRPLGIKELVRTGKVAICRAGRDT